MKLQWAAALIILSLGVSSAVLADGADDLGRLIGQKGNELSSSSSSTSSAVVQNDNILRLTPDRTHIVRLEEDAASVIVTNPAHATVMLDSPRLLVVMPRQPGATTFTVLNGKGQEILKQDVVITATQPNYVRVRRMCQGNDANCAPNAYFYCPDGCYEVMTVPGDQPAADVPDIANSNPAAAEQQGPLMPVPEAGSQQSIDELRRMLEEREQEDEIGDDLDTDGEPMRR